MASSHPNVFINASRTQIRRERATKQVTRNIVAVAKTAFRAVALVEVVLMATISIACAEVVIS